MLRRIDELFNHPKFFIRQRGVPLEESKKARLADTRKEVKFSGEVHGL